MGNSEWIVDACDHNEKLSCFLERSLQNPPSNRKIKSWIDAGRCSINGRVQRFHHTRLRTNDRVRLVIPDEASSFEASSFVPAFSKESILFEDDFLLVYNKPPGVSCDERGLVALLGTHSRVFLTHRLDKDTSGVIITAKSALIREKIEEQFRTRRVKKEYIALVHGAVNGDRGTIENYLGVLSKAHNQQICGVVDPPKKGDLAITGWECIARGKGVSLMRLYPLTGRTHQLRVHMRLIGAPILGDVVYGAHISSPFEVVRQMLHAEKISFWHPYSDKFMELSAPVPEDFKKVSTLCAILL